MSNAPQQNDGSAEFVLIESPLSKRITREGVSVDVGIYGDGEGKWILEVVDEQNTSHVWDDHFDTDQLALDEAIRTIDDEGIKSFTSLPDGPN